MSSPGGPAGLRHRHRLRAIPLHPGRVGPERLVALLASILEYSRLGPGCLHWIVHVGLARKEGVCVAACGGEPEKGASSGQQWLIGRQQRQAQWDVEVVGRGAASACCTCCTPAVPEMPGSSWRCAHSRCPAHTEGATAAPPACSTAAPLAHPPTITSTSAAQGSLARSRSEP